MHLFHEIAFVACTFLALGGAVPLQNVSATAARSARNRLMKRTNPIIGQGIDITDPNRGGKLVPRPDFPTSGAFSNAQELMAYAVFTPGTGIDSNSEIFTHYFLEEYRDMVKGVFKRLLGNPRNPEDVANEGANELGQMTFQGIDTPNDDDDMGCDQEGTRMYTDYYDTEAPVVVVCEDAWVFPDRDDQTCDGLGDKLTEDFIILGHLVLHEYTHWDWFLKDVTGVDIVDVHGPEAASGYGLLNAYRDLDKKYALANADSYAWYATEVLWSTICMKAYQAPSDDDDSDGSGGS